MPLNKLQALALPHGIPTDKVAAMHADGLTPELVVKLGSRGISFLQIFQLWQKYGPTIMAIIQEISGMLNPTPAA